MPFVRRDESGRIISVFHRPVEEGLEQVSLDDPDLAAFLRELQLDDAVNREFIASDLGFVRVLEDLIDLLIERGVFRFTDLPKKAQERLLRRRGLRKEFAYVESLFPADEDVVDEESEGGGFL